MSNLNSKGILLSKHQCYNLRASRGDSALHTLHPAVSEATIVKPKKPLITSTKHRQMYTFDMEFAATYDTADEQYDGIRSRFRARPNTPGLDHQERN